MSFDVILGFAIIYIWVHFYVIQFTKPFVQRSNYEKFLTIATAVTVVLVVIGMS